MSNLVSPNGRLGVQVLRADGKVDVLSAFAVLTAPAAAQRLSGSVTSAGVTPDQANTASFAAGHAIVGPFTPDLGRDIKLKLYSADNAVFSAQMLDSLDGGVTKLPLTIFDTPIGGPYTAPVNSTVTATTVDGETVWLDIAVTSGTLKYVVTN